MEGFIGEKEEFGLDALLIGSQWGARGDVLPGLSAGENPSGRVLHILESVQDIVWYTGQDSITVIQAGGDIDFGGQC